MTRRNHISSALREMMSKSLETAMVGKMEQSQDPTNIGCFVEVKRCSSRGLIDIAALA